MVIKYITNVRLPTPRAQGYAIMKMCSEFANLGTVVELFVPSRQNTEIEKDPFDFYSIEKNFEIKRIRSSDFLGSTTKLSRLLYWVDIIVFFLCARFKIKFNRGDILFTRDPVALLFFSKKIFSCLHIISIPESRTILKYILHKPKLFFALNDGIKKELVKMGVPESSVHISGSGVEPKDFDIKLSTEEAREKLDLPKDKKIVLYSGQFYRWKGVDTLAEVAKLMPEVIFVFVGGTGADLEQFQEKYGNLSNVIIRPFQERVIIPVYLRSSDILVIPNSANTNESVYYTSPIKLFEFMAAKKPIVASRLPSMRETLDQDSAVFAEPDDPESFALAIRKILSDGELADRIILNAYQRSLESSWAKRAKNVLNIIHENIVKI